MVLLDVGSGGVPSGAVGTRPAARGSRPGTPPAGGADGPAAWAGHGGLDPRGAAVPQADAGGWRAKDVSSGPYTRNTGSGTIIAAVGTPASPPTASRKGAGEGGEYVPLLVRAVPAGAAAARVADAGASPVSAYDAGGSQRRGACAFHGGFGRVHSPTKETSGCSGAAGRPGARAGVAGLVAGPVGNQAGRRVPLAQGGGLLSTGGVYCATGWNPHGQCPGDGRASPRHGGPSTASTQKGRSHAQRPSWLSTGTCCIGCPCWLSS